MTVLALALAALAACVAGVIRVHAMTFAFVPSLLLAAFARYGRATVHLEYRPDGGEIELVTRGFLMATERRRFVADRITQVRLVRVKDERLALPLMFNVVLRSTDGRDEDAFGRPLGITPEQAEAARAVLVRAIDEARSERDAPPISARVELDDDDELPDEPAASRRAGR